MAAADEAGDTNRFRWTRRRVLGLVAVLVVVIGAGVVWRATRFDARHETMPGLLVDLLIQPGVTDGEVAAAKDGLQVADHHLRTVLGFGATERVEVRLARSQGCRAGDSPAGPPIAWAESTLLCVNTMFQSLVTAGRWPDTAALDQIREWGIDDPTLKSLSAYERTGADGDSAYALFHLATRVLDEQASGRVRCWSSAEKPGPDGPGVTLWPTPSGSRSTISTPGLVTATDEVRRPSGVAGQSDGPRTPPATPRRGRVRVTAGAATSEVSATVRPAMMVRTTGRVRTYR